MTRATRPGHGALGGDLDLAGPDSDRQYLLIALGLILAFMVAEVIVAVWAGSLALLADAGHMLTDAGAVGGALWAVHLAARPASAAWSYGLKRAEILAAAANGVTLLVFAALMLAAALGRLIQPGPVAGLPLVIVAGLGVPVNLLAALMLSRANRRSLNIQGVFAHILTDLFAFAATGVAGVLILTLGLRRADAGAALVAVALMLWAAGRLLRTSGRVLLEGTPEGVDLEEVRRHVTELAEVVSVHDLHAWTLTSSLPVLSAHVVVHDVCLTDGSAAGVLDRLQACLAGHFDVEHSTFQLEPAAHAGHERAAHQ